MRKLKTIHTLNPGHHAAFRVQVELQNGDVIIADGPCDKLVHDLLLAVAIASTPEKADVYAKERKAMQECFKVLRPDRTDAPTSGTPK